MSRSRPASNPIATAKHLLRYGLTKKLAKAISWLRIWKQWAGSTNTVLAMWCWFIFSAPKQLMWQGSAPHPASGFWIICGIYGTLSFGRQRCCRAANCCRISGIGQLFASVVPFANGYNPLHNCHLCEACPCESREQESRSSFSIKNCIFQHSVIANQVMKWFL